MSNINVPGKFAFRIDSAEIKNGGCNVNGMSTIKKQKLKRIKHRLETKKTHQFLSWLGTLTIAPRYGPMLGGQYIVIGGPCLHSEDRVFIKYSPLVTSFLCQRLSYYSAVCITPMFNMTGDIKVNLTIKNSNEEMQHHQGIYTICEFSFIFVWKSLR